MLPLPSSKASKFSQPRRGDGVRPGQGYHRRRQRGVVPFEVGFGASGRAVRAGLASRLRLICVYDVDEVPLEDPEQLLSRPRRARVVALLGIHMPPTKRLREVGRTARTG